MSSILLVWVRVVVEVSLIRDAARPLLSTPDLLLTSSVREWLWECGRSGRESTTLLAGKGLLVVEAEVEMEAVGVAAVLLLLLLLLLLVCHGEQSSLLRQLTVC